MLWTQTANPGHYLKGNTTLFGIDRMQSFSAIVNPFVIPNLKHNWCMRELILDVVQLTKQGRKG